MFVQNKSQEAKMELFVAWKWILMKAIDASKTQVKLF
jgi:hypothetical protein